MCVKQAILHLDHLRAFLQYLNTHGMRAYFSYLHLMCSQVVGIRAKSAGHIELKTSDPFEKPHIVTNFLQHGWARRRPVAQKDTHCVKS